MSNRYTIQNELGHGAFGVTYRARDNQTGKDVAYKVIDIENSTAKGIDETSIIQELETMKSLSSLPNCSPYIACFYDALRGDFNGRPSIMAVSEFVDGSDLDHYIKDLQNMHTPASPQELWKYMIQMVSALDDVHSKGYAHRDIKPDNIMRYSSTGDLRLIDFGLACTTKCRSGAGTVLWMPPEFFKPNAPSSLKASQAHDIWSMGIVFYQLANLNFPFDVMTHNGQYFGMNQISSNIVNQPYRRSNYNQSTEAFPIANQTFNFIIEQMLNRDWQERPSARQLMQYIMEEQNGCTVNGKRYNRLQILSILNQNDITIENPNAILNSLCSLVSGNVVTQNYSNSNVAPTYASINRSYYPTQQTYQIYGIDGNSINVTGSALQQPNIPMLVSSTSKLSPSSISIRPSNPSRISVYTLQQSNI